jgi:hypothetical protein
LSKARRKNLKAGAEAGKTEAILESSWCQAMQEQCKPDEIESTAR